MREEGAASSTAIMRRETMQNKLQGAIGLLRVLAAASIVIPVALFTYASWETYREQAAKADAQISGTLDIAETHARNLFQTSDLAIGMLQDLVSGLSDRQIAARSEELGRGLRHIQRHMPQIRSIWLIDKSGHPLANSRVQPNPSQLDLSKRPYFLAEKARNAGLYIGRVVKPRQNGEPFFAVSRRRESSAGSFDGVIVIALAPDYFQDLYHKIAHDFPRSISIVLPNGVSLASDPPATTSEPWKSKALLRQAASQTGTLGLIGDADGQRFGLRKIKHYPAFIATSVRDSAVIERTASIMTAHLIFGVPATLALFFLSLAAIRNTKRLYAEGQRREVAESALKQTQKLEALGQLTGGVAHDINNLLMIVGGNAELARKDAASPRQLQRLSNIEDAVDRGRALTRQLLTFSRRQSVDPAPTDLRDHLVRARSLFDTSLGSTVRLRIEIPSGLWYVRVDRDELDIALLNLVVNARDAMPEGGELKITATNVPHLPSEVAAGELTGPFVGIAVADNGTGMSADVLERAFEPFFSTKPTARGSGLGLSQVYGFCQQAGGVATIRSRPEKGTTITLYLPKCEEAPGRPEPESIQSGASAPLSGRALLAEDNTDVGELARDHLEDLGFEVEWARNAESALQIMSQSQEGFDLVLSDIVMPGHMNGVQLAREILRLDPHATIVLMTGYAPHLAGEVEDLHILRKPFTRLSLEAALTRAFHEKDAAKAQEPTSQQLPLI